MKYEYRKGGDEKEHNPHFLTKIYHQENNVSKVGKIFYKSRTVINLCIKHIDRNNITVRSAMISLSS